MTKFEKFTNINSVLVQNIYATSLRLVNGATVLSKNFHCFPNFVMIFWYARTQFRPT